MKTKRVFNATTRKMSTVHQVETVDENGEIFEEELEITDYYHGPKFIRVFYDQLSAASKGLSATAHDIVYYFMNNIDVSNNMVDATYKSLAAYVGVSEVSVNTAMKELRERDIICLYKPGRWMLNPEMAVKCYERYRNRLITKYSEMKKARLERDGNIPGRTTRSNAEGCKDGCADVHSQPHKSDNEALR